jgi:hypothetical protein
MCGKDEDRERLRVLVEGTGELGDTPEVVSVAGVSVARTDR